VDDLIKNLQGNVAIEAVHMEQPNLEDVFIGLIEKIENE